MGPDRSPSSGRDIKSLRKLASELTGRPLSPEQVMLGNITDRLTRGADLATKMRVELYLMDVMSTVQTAKPDAKDEQLLDTIKAGSGFRNLDTTMHIPDETTLHFMGEIKTGLEEIKKRKPDGSNSQQ